MILLDTNVLIYAFDPDSAHHSWARAVLIDSIRGEGAAQLGMSLATADPSRFRTYFPTVELLLPD